VAGRLEVVPFQEAPSPPMSPALARACALAVHVVTAEGRVLRAGRAALHVLDRIGFRRTARVLGLPPLAWGVELGYRLVAGHRPAFARFFFTREDAGGA
jgi:predicted DCC family thiol-disulfide oxidoreductase YuxK